MHKAQRSRTDRATRNLTRAKIDRAEWTAHRQGTAERDPFAVVFAEYQTATAHLTHTLGV